MDFLIGVPSEHGLELLKNKLYEDIKQFELVDDSGEGYYQNDVHSVSFDSDGVLTVSFMVPKDEDFPVWNKYIRLLDKDGQEVISYETPQIQFVTGVGGEQVAKLPVSGEKSEVVFKKDDYITDYEAQELFLMPLIANTNLNISLQNKLIEKGVILND